MTLARRLTSWISVALVGCIALPVPAVAQDDEVTLPFTTSGAWEGRFIFDGHIAHDAASDDGSFSVGVTEVLGNTSITVDLIVSEDGTITGTMPVYLDWLKESAGAGPDGDPFHIVHDIVQFGELSLSGNAERLVASGMLDETSITLADGDVIETMTDSDTVDVEWVFTVVPFDCFGAGAPLTEARGNSLVRSALLPPELETSSATHYNSLVAALEMWPQSNASSEVASAAEEEVFKRSDELREPLDPRALLFTDLIDAWNDLQAEVAALNECDSADAHVVTSLDRPWLVATLKAAFGDGLEYVHKYAVDELVDLWIVARAEAVLDGELMSEFYDAFRSKLQFAVDSGDSQTIEAVAAYAEEYGLPELQAEAEAALD